MSVNLLSLSSWSHWRVLSKIGASTSRMSMMFIMLVFVMRISGGAAIMSQRVSISPIRGSWNWLQTSRMLSSLRPSARMACSMSTTSRAMRLTSLATSLIRVRWAALRVSGGTHVEPMVAPV
ncbi:hypothetical protein D3C80_1033970 [compost metagenome]